MRGLTRLEQILFLCAVASAIVLLELAWPFITSLPAVRAAAPEVPTDGLVCVHPSVDLGIVDGSEPIELEFEFVNLSSRASTIVEAKASCGCTSLDFPSGEVEPGGEVPMKVTIDWNGRGGSQVATILVRTDAARSQVQQLTVRGVVTYQATVVPNRIELGRGVGAATGRQFLITSPELADIRIARIDGVPEGWRIARVKESGELTNAVPGPPGRFIVYRESRSRDEVARLQIVLEGNARPLFVYVNVRQR